VTQVDTATGTAAGRAPPARPAARRRRRAPGRKHAELALFVGPALVVYSMFVLLPIGLAFWYAMYRWNGIGPLTDFVGLDNYRRALADPAFLGSIRHNAIIIALSLTLQLPLALGLALLLNARLRGRALLRMVVFAPFVLSEVVTGVIWLLILQPDGLADRVLQAVGLGGLVQLWLADRSIVLYTMFVVVTWKYIGFAIILFLAGLQGIPRELADAAEVDGASKPRVFRHITLPLLGPTIRVWAFLSIIGSLQLFDLIWIMTLGGPANASSTMATYMVDRGFRRYQFGYGSAVAIILFLISFAVSLAYQRLVLRRDTDGALTRMAG
jgi:raffinose/stachyose/melibiose transport system permease protein